MAKGESACQPWSWLQRGDMGRSAQPRKSLTGHHCSVSGTWALKADLDWKGLFTQGGLLQQGHQNQPTNICRSYMSLDQQLECGAWTAFPLGNSFGNTTENKPCAISKQHSSNRYLSWEHTDHITNKLPSSLHEGRQMKIHSRTQPQRGQSRSAAAGGDTKQALWIHV